MDNPGKIEVHAESQLFNRLSALAFRFVYAIAAVVGVSVLAAGLVFFVQPKYRSITDDIQKANAEKVELKKLMESYLARLDSYNARYNALPAADHDKVNYILPDDPNQEFLFALFEDIAKNHGLVLSSLKIGEEAAGKAAKGALATPRAGLGRARVTASFAGVDYRGLLTLLSALEGNLRFFDVEKVSFAPDQYTLGLELAAYYYK